MKRPRFFLIPMVAALALTGLSMGRLIAQDDDDPASKRVSMELNEQSLVDSLKFLFKSVGANYVLEPSVIKGAGNVLVTLSIADQPFIEALERVLAAGSARGTGLTYRLENGIYTVMAKDGAPVVVNPPIVTRPARVPGVGKNRVTLTLQDKNLDESLRTVFEAGNVPYVIPLRSPSSGSVSMSMTNMPFEAALLGVLKSVDLGQPLGWQEVGSGIFAIVPLPGGKGFNPEAVRLSLNLYNVSLRDALSGLFRAAGATFTLEKVQGVPVTLKLHDVTLRAAVEMLLRSSGNPNYILVAEVGVYHVGVKGR
jgi:type II secretory pathway component GspD/PulD (secretin)